MESANAKALGEQMHLLGESDQAITRAFRSFNAWSWQFRQASEGREPS
jgi:hypothetical protein